jgi:hypothetical protein
VRGRSGVETRLGRFADLNAFGLLGLP